VKVDENILIVEDEDEWCSIFMRAVDAEMSRRTVRMAKDLTSAGKLIETTKFALAIVDVGLDINDDLNVDGLHVMSKIRSIGDETSILVVTGRSGQDALLVGRDALKKYNAYDTVGKRGVTPSQLRRLVKEGLDSYRDATSSSYTDARDAISGEANPMAWDDQVMRAVRFQGDVMKFYGFLNDLFGEYLPLVRKCSEETVNVNHTTGLVLGEFWSRAIGEAIFICFGAAEGFDQASLAARTELGLPEKAEQPVKELKSHGIKGVVFAVPEHGRDYFDAK
jgi:hypothetical protein